MSTHIWHEITFTRVEPKLEADGTISITVPEAAREASNQDKRYGCYICDMPLKKDTIDTPCNPTD